MTDILIRDVPDLTVRRIDHLASQQELSRSEFLRRRIDQIAGVDDSSHGPIDWTYFAQIYVDLDDPEVMGQAWR